MSITRSYFRNNSPDLNCFICLEGQEKGEMLTHSFETDNNESIGHSVHKKCIQDWWAVEKKEKTCPICKCNVKIQLNISEKIHHLSIKILKLISKLAKVVIRLPEILMGEEVILGLKLGCSACLISVVEQALKMVL